MCDAVMRIFGSGLEQSRRNGITRCGLPAPGGFTGYEHRGRTISGHARAAAASRRGHAMTLPEA